MDPQTVKTFKIVGIVAGAIVASASVFGLARPILISDPPPWAGKEQVMAAFEHLTKKIDARANQTEATIVRGNINGAWRSCKAAMSAGNRGEAQAYAAQVGTLQDSYRALTGGYHPLDPCP